MAWDLQEQSAKTHGQKAGNQVSLWLRFPQGLITILVALTPLWYINGYMYHTGELDAFQIDPKYFPESVNQYFTEAFTAHAQVIEILFDAVVNNPGFVFFVGTCVAILAIIMITAIRIWMDPLISGPVLVLGQKAQKWSWYRAVERVLTQTIYWIPAIAGFVGSLWLLVLPFVGAMLFLLCAWPYLVANHYARHDIRTFYPCTNGRFVRHETCTYLYDHGQLVAAGILVDRSDSYMAIYNGESASVYPSAGLTVIIPRMNTKKRTSSNPQPTKHRR